MVPPLKARDPERRPPWEKLSTSKVTTSPAKSGTPLKPDSCRKWMVSKMWQPAPFQLNQHLAGEVFSLPYLLMLSQVFSSCTHTWSDEQECLHKCFQHWTCANEYKCMCVHDHTLYSINQISLLRLLAKVNSIIRIPCF